MGQSASIRQGETEYVRLLARVDGRSRNQQFGKSTKAKNKYYKRSTKDDLVLRAMLEAITRMG